MRTSIKVILALVCLAAIVGCQSITSPPPYNQSGHNDDYVLVLVAPKVVSVSDMVEFKLGVQKNGGHVQWVSVEQTLFEVVQVAEYRMPAGEQASLEVEESYNESICPFDPELGTPFRIYSHPPRIELSQGETVVVASSRHKAVIPGSYLMRASVRLNMVGFSPGEENGLFATSDLLKSKDRPINIFPKTINVIGK